MRHWLSTTLAPFGLSVSKPCPSSAAKKKGSSLRLPACGSRSGQASTGSGRAAIAVAVALFSTPLNAQTAAGTFTIAGQRFATASILDARALPALDGGAAILVTFAPDGAKQLAALTKASIGKEVPVALDGKTLAAPMVREPVETGTVEIAGKFTLAEAEAIAKRISGKDPLPEEFEE